MSDTQKPEIENVTVARITERSVRTFCLFSIALCLTMVFSWFVVLPQLTRIELNGTLVGIDELQHRHSDIQQQLKLREAQRNQLILPIQDNVYTELRDWKHRQTDYRSLVSAIEGSVMMLSEDGQSVVHLTKVHLERDSEGFTLHLEGDVRNVGPRSMTVLAQFVETLRGITGVDSVQSPRFERREDPEVGPHSPFVLSLHLQ